MDNNLEIVEKIRFYTTQYRKEQQVKNVDYFFLAMLEISANLVELGLVRNREITNEEENNWFKGSYHLDYWDSEINTTLYIPLVKIAESLNYFRKL